MSMMQLLQDAADRNMTENLLVIQVFRKRLLLTTLELWGVAYQMGSHSVTCYPTQVNTPRLNSSQTGRYL